ncbi:MAG: glycosyltransferase [Cytophagaceae bacterium]|nr:glycosyltransferase [Cytophagaceae bacterium]
MIKNQAFVCIANNTWESNFSNTLVEIMTVLSTENRILYVDYEYTFKDVLRSLSGKQKAPLKRIFGWENRLRKIKTKYQSEVYVLTPPPVFPINGIRTDKIYKAILKANAWIVKRSIKKAMRQLNIDNPVVVTGFNPVYGLPLHNSLNEKLNVYYCYDEIDGGWYKLHGPSMEKQYMQKADLVITSSEALYNTKSCLCRNCALVKNGVDFDLFNSAANPELKKGNKKPVIGYTGSIDRRFDTDTVIHAVKNFPEAEFLFIGRITKEEVRIQLQHFPNVTFQGSVKPEEVPGLLKKIDIGIIPYVKDNVTQGVYPLKINEYLAAGKPVVMTDFAKLSEFDNVVRFAASKEEFLQFLKSETENDSAEKRKLRIEIAEKNSWKNRAEEFSSLIENALEENNALDKVA